MPGYKRHETEWQEDVLRRLRLLGVKRGDVVERFVRSSGPGGQNVNKTATCVYLQYVPAGITVKCSQERSQAQNRRRAWEILMGKIEAQTRASFLLAKRQEYVLRQQKRSRSAAAARKILEDKRKRSQKKRLRNKVRDNGE